MILNKAWRREFTYIRLMANARMRILLEHPFPVLSVSDGVEALLGFAADDFLSSRISLQDRFHAHDVDIAKALFSPGTHQKPGTFNVRLRHKNGGIACVQAIYSKTRDDKGHIVLELNLQDARNIQQALGEASILANFKAMMENTDDFIYFKDRNHVFTGASQTLVTLAAPAQHWTDLLGKTDYDLFPEEYADIYYSLEKQVFAGIPVAREIQEILRNDGTRGYVDNRKYPIKNAAGEIIGLFGIARDITDRKENERDLEILTTALNRSSEVTMLLDEEHKFVYVNDAACQTLGYTREELATMTPLDIDPDLDLATLEAIVEIGPAIRGSSRTIERRHRARDGHIFPVEISYTWFEFEGANYILTFCRDISERKRTEETINQLAFYDQLTGLPNRTLLRDRIQQAMSASIRTQSYGALLLLDLDNFKMLNDTLGHAMGDALLQQLARRLSETVRETDTVARLGGDEFVVLLVGLSGIRDEAVRQVERVCEKIYAVICQCYLLKEIPYYITPSIGASFFQDHLTGIDELIKQADLAMYKAKSSGRNNIRFFDQEMELVVTQRARLENELREAIEREQFVLHYQAQVAKNKIVGAEALARWAHPHRGLVSPAEFIPLAEETGMILKLGNWVFEAACQQLARWAKNPALAHLSISVNVSAGQISQTDFIDQLLNILNRTGANPQRLSLELTESVLLSNVDLVIKKMYGLKALGVSFSLDDFGTGYSSLAYLKRLPLDQLKIDKSFVRDVLVDPSDATIAKTIIALSDSLGLGVIAEGVETAMQRDFLAEAGCHAYQGYFFSYPMPVNDFERFAVQA